MKPVIFICFVLFAVGCEQTTEPTVEPSPTLDGWWKFDFVTYEYGDQREIVTGQFELRTGSENLVGVLVHNGRPYVILGVEFQNRIILSALAENDRMIFYVEANPEKTLLIGHVELLRYYGTYWSTNGYYSVTIQRK